MKRNEVVRWSVSAMIVASLLFVSASWIHAQESAEFIPLGVTCGPAFMPTFCAVDLSGDGQTVLTRAGLWTEADGLMPISGPTDGWESIALSDDGTTVVGNVRKTDEPLGSRTEAAKWLGGSEWLALGGLPNTSPCGSSYTSAYDVSGDGTEIVGLAWIGMSCVGSAHGFNWNESDGMTDLGALVDGRASRVNAISADGMTRVGWSDTEFGSRLGAIWDENGLRWFEGPDSANYVGEAHGVNSDGTIVVGGGYSRLGDPNSYFEAWVWREETGVVSLGPARGLRGDVVDGQNLARDLSDDGSVIAGQTTMFLLGQQWAWIWTEANGMEMLQDYLRRLGDDDVRSIVCESDRSSLGPACTGWDFWNVAAVSNDGSVIVGTGRNPDGLWEAFMIRTR